MTTICGIPVASFATRPTPVELAKIVAAMHGDDQAEFLIALGEALHFGNSGYKYHMQLSCIRAAMTEKESELVTTFGSDLIHDLQIEAESQL